MNLESIIRQGGVSRLRPWLENGKSWCRISDGVVRLSDAPARLTKEQWVEVDREVKEHFALRARLTHWLLTHTLQHDLKGEFGAEVMPLKLSITISLPLPLTHANCQGPIMAAAASRRVADAVEQTLLGKQALDGIQGLMTHSKTVRLETVAQAAQVLCDTKFYGPYVLVHPASEAPQPEWSSALIVKHNDEAIKIEPPTILASPFLSAGELIMFQATSDVIRMVAGLPPTLVQWEDGFEVVAILVPQVRADHYGNVGIAVRKTA